MKSTPVRSFNVDGASSSSEIEHISQISPDAKNTYALADLEFKDNLKRIFGMIVDNLNE